jgi:hypothetical protein
MGNAMLGLQEFIEPSVNYVFQSQNVEQKEEENDKGLGGDEQAVRADLAEALSQTPVDPEEVRRHLSTAVRLGIDWKALFDQVASEELRERPFRAPSIPRPSASHRGSDHREYLGAAPGTGPEHRHNRSPHASCVERPQTSLSAPSIRKSSPTDPISPGAEFRKIKRVSSSGSGNPKRSVETFSQELTAWGT